MRLCILVACGLAAALASAAEQAGPTDQGDGLAVFEQHIRPLLSEYCYKCHSASSEKIKGDLRLDTRQGMQRGGTDGAILVAGDPEHSRLMLALRWSDHDLQMPPKKQLEPQQIRWFETWIKLGAPDPRGAGDGAAPALAAAAKHGLDLATGRSWWSFQPVSERPPPAVRNSAWVERAPDPFILARLEAAGLAPSPRSDRRTLIRRAYLDLIGLRPSFEEVEAFARDQAPDAYPRLIDRLLASEQYGERWGRYWLDVVRYGEDNPQGQATNPGYRYAWRYRDWVIRALNRDLPYDRFVQLQLAADEMAGIARDDLVALGFLGLGPVYHKDARLSKDVVGTLQADDWDERIDTVTRGFLGLTVACARCHDHKFDAVTSQDYYALQGVFASVGQVARPLVQLEPALETRYMLAEQRLFYLGYAANLMRTEPGSKPEEARAKVQRWNAEIDSILSSFVGLREEHPELVAELERLTQRAAPGDEAVAKKPAAPALAKADAAKGGDAQKAGDQATGNLAGQAVEAAPKGKATERGSSAPFFHAVFDAGTFINSSDPDFTFIDLRAGEARDMPVLPGGNMARPGAVAPRRFIAVLAKDAAPFRDRSGRRELAERLFSDAAPLAARVMVNRVWAWHFARPLVATLSDFGVQGERPTHPELLDDLAARFISHGWSLKWLQREIMLSAAYQQASRPRDDALAVDPTNRLLWRMNPRRLDAEALLDCLQQAGGTLDPTMYGPSQIIDQTGSFRRAVYARVGREGGNRLFRLFDFPEPSMHSPGREVTTTPIQQLFTLNSQFIQERAAALNAATATGSVAERVRLAYHRVFARDPTAAEATLADEYFSHGGTPAAYAQALLATNEVQYWP